MHKKILTIAGSDSLAGGGLQTDLKTIENHHCFGLSVTTCIASIQAQQFQLFDIPPAVVNQQLDSIFQSTTIDAVKIGLIHQLETIAIIQHYLAKFNLPVILDPVLAFKETTSAMNRSYMEDLIKRLFPQALIVTPNLEEAALLTGMTTIQTFEEMKQAAQQLHTFGPRYVVIKGGTRFPGQEAADLLYDGQEFIFFKKEKLAKPTVNGAGCTFASAIAANYLMTQNMQQTIEKSKQYVYQAIQHGIELSPEFGNVWYPVKETCT